MFKVRQMSSEDFQFAKDLANTQNWNMEIEDFEFNSSLEPQGCFIIAKDSQKIGIATSVSFGKIGWFGNFVIKEKYRGQGAGSLLVEHAVKYLQSKGVETVGLYAYQDLVNFYAKLGFKSDEDFQVLNTNSLEPLNVDVSFGLASENIGEIVKFDAEFFGGNRKKLLETIVLEEGNLGYYASKRNKILGYAAATVYEKLAWVGPLIFRAGENDSAELVLKAILAKLTGANVYLALARKEASILSMLFKVGFKEEFTVTRMFLGPPVTKNCIYVAESLERG